MNEPWQIKWKDYYEALQVIPEAELEVIEGAYKRLAGKYHPDKKPTGDVARFLLIREAYDVLSNPLERTKYDDAYHDYLQLKIARNRIPKPDRRIICNNGMCRGVIDDYGICPVCQRAYIDESQRDLATKPGKPMIDEEI